ncbi:unnamed protein product [Symbiodinium sp. KB8]|nr:unnamed protein product [Symbiodinium sp. KB8]
MNDYNQSFSRLRLTSLGDQELHRNQEIARESSRQLTVLLAEGTKQFDKKQLQMVKVGKDGPGQEFRTNLAAFSKFLCQFWETKWLDGLVAPEFAEQKDLAVKLMDDLQKPKNLCPWCQVSYFGTHCMKCNRCPCGYYAHQHVRCAHFGGSCQRCGATAFQQGTFCESCGYCVHGRHQSYGQGCGCKSQTRKKAKTAKTAETCKTALDSAQKKLDHEATSREQLTELASMADTLAKLCRKDAKVMETAEKEFQKKMVLLKAFAEAINDVPKVLRCFLLFRCGAIKEDPTSLKEWLSKAEVEEVHRQLEEFRDEAGEADRAVFLVEDNPDEPGCRIHLKAHLPVPAAQASGTSAGPAAQDDDSESSSSECGDAPEPGTIELPASQIRWAHNSIKAAKKQVRFRNGMLLVDTLKELLDGSASLILFTGLKLKISTFVAAFLVVQAEVWQRGNTWFAITGNRRLWVLRELAEISAAEVFVRARRRLNPGVHLSPWFRNMFTTDCDGRLQVAQELQQLPDPVLLADLEQRFAGQFSVGEAPPSAPMGPLQDPWASGRDPLSQSLEASASDRAEAPRWKAPPLSRMQKSSTASHIRLRSSGSCGDARASSEAEAAASPGAKLLRGGQMQINKRMPGHIQESRMTRSEAEPQPNRAGSSADSDSEDSDLMKEPEEAGYANAASQADWPKRFPSRGFAVAALRAHTAPTQTDMAVGQILCSVPGGSLTEQELIERCQAKLVGSSKRFKKLYWKRYWVQKSHLFTAKGTKVAFAPPLPVIYEGQDVLPETTYRVKSSAYPAGTKSQDLQTYSLDQSKADMQIGWILKRAGGQLDRMTIRDHLNRDLLAEHLKGGGSSTPPPMQKLKPKDFWPKPHLFVFSDRTDLVSFAVPPRLVRPQDGCHSAGEKGTGSRDDGSSKSAGNGAASGGEGSRQSPTFTGSDASSVPSSKTVAEAEVQMAQPQPVPKQPIETKGVHCKVHKHSHMGLAIVSVQSASIREAIFRLLQSRSGCNDGQAQLCIGDVRVELKRQVVCRQEVVTGIFVAWGRQQEKDCPLAAESIATTFDQLTQEALAFSTTPSANQLGHKSSTPQAAAPGDSSRTRMCLQTSLPAPVEAVPVRGVDNAGGLEPVLGKSQQSPPGVWQQSPPLLKPGQGQRCICNLGGLLSKLPPKIFQTMDVRAYAHAQRLIFQSGWPVQASGVLPDVRLMQVVVIDFLAELSAWSFCRARTVTPEEPKDPLASVRKVIQEQCPEVLIAEFVDGDVCVQCAQLCFSAAISETGIKDQRNFQISNSPVSGGCFRKACPSPGMYPRFCFLTWGTDLLLYAKPYTLRLHNCNSGLNLAPGRLGFPVVPFCPFYLGVSLLKPNIRKKGTLIIKGLLGNLDVELDPLNPKPQIL